MLHSIMKFVVLVVFCLLEEREGKARQATVHALKWTIMATHYSAG